MKILKRVLIILIIAATIFTVVKCSKTEEIDNIKQEQGDDTLPKDDKKDTNKKDEQDKGEKEEEEIKDNEQDKEEVDKDEEPKEEIKSPVELG